MRALPLLVLVAVLGCDAKPNPTPAAEVLNPLRPGDPAPPLAVTKWLNGDPVELKPGTVYVVDFWATWCGPCLAGMPHLDSLAREYSGKGVEFIAVTSLDEQGNTFDRVERFMAQTGNKMSVHFAWRDDASMFDAWLGAAGLSSFPTIFVIDRDGKIADIGHYPSKLDDILPRVLAGTWRGKADYDEIDAVNTRLLNIFDRVQAAGGTAASKLPFDTLEEKRQEVFGKAAAAAAAIALTDLATFEKEYPRKAAGDDVLSQKMLLLMRVGRHDEARAIARPLLERRRASQDTEAIDHIRRYWLGKAANPERKHLDVPVAAAEMILAIVGEEDINAVLAAAESYAAVGNTEKFETYARKARMLTALDLERNKRVETLLKSFQK